ncbi:MAG: hypothetical protein HY586_04825 [Candidatus Omnitrophica bacterium]|nr:hypothetical protein [Candidatus Omnitrophota bacterium]
MLLKKRNPGKRLTQTVSSLITLIFTWTSVLPASGILEPPLLHPPYLTQVHCGISPDLGRIKEFFPLQKSPEIYLVEDAHESLDAQEKIRLILKELVEKERVKKIYFEGGSFKLDRRFYAASRLKKINEKVWNRLFEMGEIGGVERYALEAPRHIRFFGMEDPDVYFNNVHSVQNIYRAQTKIGTEVKKLDADFKKAAARFIQGELKNFLKLKKQFEEKKISLDRYTRELALRAKKIAGIDFQEVSSQKKWPQYVRLMAFLKYGVLHTPYTVHRTQYENDSFLWNPDEHWRARGHLRWYFERWLDGLGPNVPLSPELKHWIRYHILKDELDAESLRQEIGCLEDLILAKMKLSGETLRFLNQEKRWNHIKKLLRLELTRSEWCELKKMNLYSPLFQKLKKEISMAFRNYELVEKRDKIFDQRLPRNKTSEKIAVVLGGFHSEVLISNLKKENSSFTVVTPNIKDPNRCLDYRSRILVPRQTAPVVVGASLNIPEAGPFIRHFERVRAESLGRIEKSKPAGKTAISLNEDHSLTAEGETPFNEWVKEPTLSLLLPDQRISGRRPLFSEDVSTVAYELPGSGSRRFVAWLDLARGQSFTRIDRAEKGNLVSDKVPPAVSCFEWDSEEQSGGEHVYHAGKVTVTVQGTHRSEVHILGSQGEISYSFPLKDYGGVTGSPLILSPDGEHLAVANRLTTRGWKAAAIWAVSRRDHNEIMIHLYETKSGQLWRWLKVPAEKIEAMHFSPDGRYLFAITSDVHSSHAMEKVHIFDLYSAQDLENDLARLSWNAFAVQHYNWQKPFRGVQILFGLRFLSIYYSVPAFITIFVCTTLLAAVRKKNLAGILSDPMLLQKWFVASAGVIAVFGTLFVFSYLLELWYRKFNEPFVSLPELRRIEEIRSRWKEKTGEKTQLKQAVRADLGSEASSLGVKGAVLLGSASKNSLWMNQYGVRTSTVLRVARIVGVLGEDIKTYFPEEYEDLLNELGLTNNSGSLTRSGFHLIEKAIFRKQSAALLGQMV